MKTNLNSVISISAAVALIAGAAGYITRLELRARRLESRLARVEGALYAAPRPPALTFGPSTNGVATLFWKPGTLAPPQRQDSLESRVEKIERAMTPHLELLSTAKPEAIGVER